MQHIPLVFPKTPRSSALANQPTQAMLLQRGLKSLRYLERRGWGGGLRTLYSLVPAPKEEFFRLRPIIWKYVVQGFPRRSRCTTSLVGARMNFSDG